MNDRFDTKELSLLRNFYNLFYQEMYVTKLTIICLKICHKKILKNLEKNYI